MKADFVSVVVHVPAVMAAFVFGEGDDLPVEVALDVLVARFEVGVLEDREGGFFLALRQFFYVHGGSLRVRPSLPA